MFNFEEISKFIKPPKLGETSKIELTPDEARVFSWVVINVCRAPNEIISHEDERDLLLGIMNKISIGFMGQAEFDRVYTEVQKRVNRGNN